MVPDQYIYRKNICPENSVKKIFDEKIFGRKFFLGPKKKFGKQKKCLSGGRVANHQSVSMNAQFRGSDFRKNTAIAGQLGGRFLVFFCCELCVEKKSCAVRKVCIDPRTEAFSSLLC